jgi:hypothetical protein
VTFNLGPSGSGQQNLVRGWKSTFSNPVMSHHGPNKFAQLVWPGDTPARRGQLPKGRSFMAACGRNHTLAAGENAVFAWGIGGRGQLGCAGSSLVPRAVCAHARARVSLFWAARCHATRVMLNLTFAESGCAFVGLRGVCVCLRRFLRGPLMGSASWQWRLGATTPRPSRQMPASCALACGRATDKALK